MISIEEVINVYDDWKWLLPCVSIALSFIFIVFFFIRWEAIAKVKLTNEEGEEKIKEKLKQYVGRTSFFYKTYCEPKHDGTTKKETKYLKRGLLKNLRYFYSAWFYVFIITALLSAVSYVQYEYEKEFEILKCEKINTSECEIIADITKDTSDYKIEKGFLTTAKDSLKIPLKMRIFSRNNMIIKDYPLEDTIIVYFDKGVFLKNNNKNTKIEYKIEQEKKQPAKTKYITTCEKKDTCITIEDAPEYINKIKLPYPNFIDTAISKYVSLKDTIVTLTKNDSIQNKNIDECISTKIAAQNDKMDSLKEGNKGDSSINIFIYQNRKINALFTALKKNKIRNSKLDTLIVKIDIRNKKFDSYITELKNNDSIITTWILSQAENIKELKDIQKTFTPATKRNLYAIAKNILSLSANIILLLFFVFLNTKTDLFEKEKKSGPYMMYKNLIFGVFAAVVLIQLLSALSLKITFSESFLFVIQLMIALTSVIAIFGWWGSMNNSYTSFYPILNFIMLLYAMIHFFEVSIVYPEANFNKLMEAALLIVSVLAKGIIIYILLVWLPNSKRALWFFFTTVNNFRTDNDYDDFVKIFDNKANGQLKLDL